MIKYKNGNLIDLAFDGQFDVIVHGCNCFCTMGAGIAKEIKQRIPSAYQADLETQRGEDKVGKWQAINVDKKFICVNAYTQYYYGGGVDHFNYAAFEQILRGLFTAYPGKRFGFPKIGQGHAGGQWPNILVVFETAMKDFPDADVTIVLYKE